MHSRPGPVMMMMITVMIFVPFIIIMLTMTNVFVTGRVMQAEVHRCLLVQSVQSIDLTWNMKQLIRN